MKSLLSKNSTVSSLDNQGLIYARGGRAEPTFDLSISTFLFVAERSD